MNRKIALSGIIMAMYVAVTIALGPFSYGLIQIRFAAGIYVLGARYPFLIIPLGIAASMANLYGGLGPWDVVGGFAATVAAVAGCWLFRKHNWLVPAAIPLFSAPILAGYLHLLFRLPFWATLIYIGIGQTIAAYTVGVGLLKADDLYNRRHTGL